MKISRKRAPLAVAGVALTAALMALPATAAADESKATLIPHGYNGPTIDGKFGDWANIPYVGTEPNLLENRGLIKAHYNCKTGKLSVAVRGVRNGEPMPPVQEMGGAGNGTAPYLTVERLPSKAPDPDAKYGPYNSKFAYGDGGYEMAVPLKSPGAYKLHYYAGRPAPEPVVTAAGTPDVEPLPYEISGYAYIKVHCPRLGIEKSAKGYYDHMYDWSVKKAATVLSKDSKTPVVKYDIDVKKMGPRVINRDVRGTIRVTNHGHIPVPRVKVTDHGIGAKDRCRITGVRIDKKKQEYRKGENYVLLKGLYPKSSAHVDYICHPHPDIPPHKLPKKPVNKASVSWAGYGNNGNNGNSGGNGDVSAADVNGGPRNIAYTGRAFQFDTLDDVYKEAVNLFDHNGKSKKHLGAVEDSKTISYTTKLAAPKRGCKVYTNTASLVDFGNKSWNPRSTAKVKICRGKDGAVVAEVKNPPKPSVDYDKRRRCYVNLRTQINGPRVIRAPRPAAFRIRIANRGKLAAGNVRTRISVPKGVRVVGIRGVPRKAVKIRGRHVYLRHKWVPRGRGRSVGVLVRPSKRIKRPMRGMVRVVAKHGCDTARSAKRVVVMPLRPPRPDNDNDNDNEVPAAQE